MGPLLGLATGALQSLSGVSPWLLGLALLLHLAKMTAEARAWHGIVASSHEGPPVPFHITLGAFVGSIGANAILPARVGEAFRLGIVRRHACGSTVPAVGGTIVLETLLELVFGVLVVGVVLGAGRSVGVVGAPLGSLAGHSMLLVVSGAALALGVALGLVFRRRVALLARGMAPGFAVVQEPRALSRVVGWKVVAWSLRVTSVLVFLVAFGLPATPWTAALVLAAQTAAATLPLTPGNAGVQQAALVATLSGTASVSTALGFGVGMQGATIVTDFALGVFAIAAIAGRGELLAAVATLRRRSPSAAAG